MLEFTLPKIEYFYSAHSAFAYIGARRLNEICKVHDCTLVHRPINLSPVVEAVGGRPFAGRSQAHVDYYFGREIERWAEWRDVDIINFRPTFHDNPLDLSNGMLIAADMQKANVDTLSLAILQAHWKDDADIADPDTLAEIAHSVGIDGAPLLRAAFSDDVQAIHAANTKEAIERNVFGSPTYFVDGDMFYGQDHLELIEHTLTHPFRPYSWSNPSAAV